MGLEAKCEARMGRQTSTGKALLEEKDLVFRGDFRRQSLDRPNHSVSDDQLRFQ